MKGAARVLDPTVHGGLLNTGAPGVLVNGRPAVRVGDHHGCIQHGPGPVVAGSPMVWIGGRLMARVGDLLMCIGAGSGTDEKGGDSATGPGYAVDGSVDADKLQAKGSAKGQVWKGEAEAGGVVAGDIKVGAGEAEGQISPAGVSGKGEGAVVEGSGRLGTEENYDKVTVKVGAVEAEKEQWSGERDGKYGFGFKDKRGADGVTIKHEERQTYSAGDYSFEDTSYKEWSKGAEAGPPGGIWAYVDPESGEICIGGYVEIPGIDVEIGRQKKFRWKPKPGGAGGGGGSGAIPNFIAAGSFDVFLG